MVLGEYGITALIGIIVNIIYLVAEGIQTEASTIATVTVGVVLLVLVAVVLGVTFALMKMPITALNSMIGGLKGATKRF